MRKVLLQVVLVAFLSSPLFAQAFLPDLERGDIDAVEQKMSLLGTSFSKQPVLALYLQAANPNPEVVKQLIQKGANVNMASPKTKLPPLYIAVTSRHTPEIVQILLTNGARIDLPFPGAWGKTILDYSLADEQYQNASLVLKANASLAAKSRLSIDKRYATKIVFLTDNIEKAKAAIANSEFPQTQIWKMALAAESRKIIETLVKLYDKPEISDDDIRFIGGNTNLLDYMVSVGFVFTSDQLQTAGLYEYLIAQRNLTSITKIRSMDLVKRPELYQAALNAGIEYLSALTKNFADITSEDLYENGLAIAIYKKADAATTLSLISRLKPSTTQLLSLYDGSPALFLAIVGSDSTGMYALTGAPTEQREQTWREALQNNDTKGMMALAKIDPGISPRIASLLLQQNSSLFSQLVDSGLRLTETDALWYDMAIRGQFDIFPMLLKIVAPPSDLVRRLTGQGDQALFALLKAGYKVNPTEIDWDTLIRKSYSSSLAFLSQAGIRPPAEAVVTAFAYSQSFFLSLPREDRQLTRDQLGTVTVDYDGGGGKSLKRLALEVAIDKGFLDSIMAVDRDLGIFEPDRTVQDPATYPVNSADSARGRTALKYFAVIAGHSAGSTSSDYLTGEKAQRGFGPDGYNDFLTNNFNVLSFLIAVKYDQKAVAQYILGRDPQIKSSSVFSGDEMRGFGVYKFSVSDFVSKKYRRNSAAAILQ